MQQLEVPPQASDEGSQYLAALKFHLPAALIHRREEAELGDGEAERQGREIIGIASQTAWAPGGERWRVFEEQLSHSRNLGYPAQHKTATDAATSSASSPSIASEDAILMTSFSRQEFDCIMTSVKYRTQVRGSVN